MGTVITTVWVSPVTGSSKPCSDPSQLVARSAHCLTSGHGWLPQTPSLVSVSSPTHVEPPKQILVRVALPPPPHGTEQAPHSDHGENSTFGAVHASLCTQTPSSLSRKSPLQTHIPKIKFKFINFYNIM